MCESLVKYFLCDFRSKCCVIKIVYVLNVGHYQGANKDFILIDFNRPATIIKIRYS